jgi:hypothetical protein
MTQSEYIITIDSIVKAINDLSAKEGSNFGGAGLSLTSDVSEYTYDLVKVRLGILSIYSKLNTLLPIAQKLNEGSSMDRQQEALFTRTMARVEEYLSYSNIKRDMLFRISPVESTLHARVKVELDSLGDIRDGDAINFINTIRQAIKPLLADNTISASYMNDFVIDLAVDVIELDTRVFKLIREIEYKRKLVGSIDISQGYQELKANLENQAKQFSTSEKIAINRVKFDPDTSKNEEIAKVITAMSTTSVQLDYMTQLMNHESTNEQASADNIYNAIFRSKDRIHDNINYTADPVTELNNHVGVNGFVSKDAVRKILPEIENLLNIFARITKTKEFAGPKVIADALYSYVALHDLSDLNALTPAE